MVGFFVGRLEDLCLYSSESIQACYPYNPIKTGPMACLVQGE